MNKERVRKELTLCLRGETNDVFFGLRALHHVKTGADVDLVQGAMARLVAREVSFLPACRRLPDEFAPLAVAALKRSKDLERSFLDAYLRDDAPLGPQLRKAASWLHELTMVDDHQRGRERVAELTTDARAVEAAQAVVAARGTQAGRYLAIVAHEGSESSADVLLPLVLSASSKRDERLDVLVKWLVPFITGTHLAPALHAIEGATTAREDASPLQSLLTTLGVEGTQLKAEFGMQSLEVKEGFLRRAGLAVWLQTKGLPHARIAVSRYGRDANPSRFTWADGTVTHDSLKLKPPANIESLPKWLIDTGKKLGVHWAPPHWMTLSLRGAARKRFLDWIVGG